ncbi:MAG: 6-phosphofructokinase [Chloroflexi bacterium]|nr:6-phosphofructokinase [Chloroflexota bacterium]
MRRIGVLTSGGDSPGFNPCVRAVVRMALYYGWEPWGIRRGYEGLLDGELGPLTSRSVSNIIGRGGTMLGASRSEAFQTPYGQREALRNLNERGIDALIVIGGDGSLRGAEAIDGAGIPTIGIPGTIENDICGTDVSIGVDTALNTALDAMDRIKDTASSHQQAFLVEMMGEKSGYLTLMAGIAGGAEMVCIPEMPFTLEDVAREVADSYVRGKKHCIITVAEGARPRTTEIAEYLQDRQKETGFGVRLSILGHIQRGGAPSAFDRFLGTRLGAAAVEHLHAGQRGVMVGMVEDEIVTTPLAEATACTRSLEEEYFELARMLAR